MTPLVFLLRHRAVDLVAVSAAAALRDALGLGERLRVLRRDDGYSLENLQKGSQEEWMRACVHRSSWFNPNTHRHALFEAAPGAHTAALGGGSWPEPWLGRLLGTDRPELAKPGSCNDLDAWLSLPPERDSYRVSLLAFDSEEPVRTLPKGHWPDAKGQVLAFQLWTLLLAAPDEAAAYELALEVSLARSRSRGLLIHPHRERWALAAPVALSREG
jgi:hypothetical protein